MIIDKVILNINAYSLRFDVNNSMSSNLKTHPIVVSIRASFDLFNACKILENTGCRE